MPEPRVSVFIPTYNRAHYLPQCLDSILAQTYQDFEIVVVDDGSTDHTFHILSDYQKRFPGKFHYHWHPAHANKGVAATSNLAISKTRGEYLALTGSDDVWHPERLELQVARLDSSMPLGMVYSYAEFIDGDGRPLPGRAGADITVDESPVAQILQFCHPPAMTVVIRRRCLEDVGVFDETLPSCEDWDLWIRVFSRWKVGFISQPLAKYRIHTDNMSKGIDPKLDLRRILIMYRRLEPKIPQIGGEMLKPRNRAILDLQLAFHLFCDDEKEEAVKHLHSAFQKDPSLCDDVAFLNDWLNAWKPDFYTPEHNHFGFWFIDHLPKTMMGLRSQLLELQLKNPDTQAFFVRRGIGRGKSHAEPVDMAQLFDDCPDGLQTLYPWKTDVLKKIYPALLFDSCGTNSYPKMRYYWRKTVRLNWTCLANRGILSIGLRALLGGGRLR